MWIFTQSALAGKVRSSQPSLCAQFDGLSLWLFTQSGSISGQSGGLLCLCKQLDGSPSLGSDILALMGRKTSASAHGTAGYLPCRSRVDLLLPVLFFLYLNSVPAQVGILELEQQ